jgi:hypothetical protein
MTMTDITNYENRAEKEPTSEASNFEEQIRNADPTGEDSNDSNSTLNTLRSLVIINKAYQEAIDEKLAQLNKLLHKNLHQQVCFIS